MTPSLPTNADHPNNLEDKILYLHRIINSPNSRERLSPGDLAELRRMHPNKPERPPVFWRLWSEVIDTEDRSQQQEQRWVTILTGMARVPHQNFAFLGKVMAGIGIKEGRLLRLLNSREEERLLDAAGRIFRMVAVKGEKLDWVPLARFLLTQDEGKADTDRRKIAKDYYTHIQKQ